MRFIPELPLDSITPAPYNPRRISPASYERLKASLSRWGVRKPVILNGNGMLVAGHQRVRALKELGAASVPAVSLGATVSLQDEIRFNLFHNSIETDRSVVSVGASVVQGWDLADWSDVVVERRDKGSAQVVKEMSVLLLKYGAWGSVVADDSGLVVANSDYALACRLTHMPVLVYRMVADDVPEFLAALNGEYGSYDYTALGVKTYNQFRAQPERLSGITRYRSVLYETSVLPELTKGERAVDFGAGRCAYPKLLAGKGYRVLAYEPYMRAEGTRSLDIAAVVRQLGALADDVRAHGLFDAVICEAVLNSTTSLQYQHRVMAACNALTAAHGRLHISTRSMAVAEAAGKSQRAHAGRVNRRGLEFLDKDNYGASFRDGVWTLQHFHSEESFAAMLEPYYRIDWMREEGEYLHARCSAPKPMDPAVLREALDVELNMEYPGGVRHDRQGPLVELLLGLAADRDHTSVLTT